MGEVHTPNSSRRDEFDPLQRVIHSQSDALIHLPSPDFIGDTRHSLAPSGRLTRRKIQNILIRDFFLKGIIEKGRYYGSKLVYF